MTLIEKIKQDQLTARKNREDASLLTTLIGEAEMIGKNAGNRTPTDEEVVALIKKFINNNVVVINATKNSAQAHYAHIENKFLETYLPQQLTEDQMRGIIVSAGLNTKKDVMTYFKANYAGQYDGKILSSLV